MQSEIEKVELSIEVAKEGIEIGKKALRLAENKDFQELILQGYLKENAARLTGLLGDKNVPEQDEVIRDLHGIASFQRYMRQLVRHGEMMEKALQDSLQALDEMRQESDYQ